MFSGKLINYNCYTNEVLYAEGSKTYLLDPKGIDYLEFQVHAKSMVFKHVFIEDLKQSLFAQVLYEGRSTLYKRHYREYKAADYGSAYSSDQRYNEYINHHDFYISVDQGEALPLKPKKKDLLKIMQDHAAEVEAFIKAEKLKLKNDWNLVKVVEYWDSLVTQSQ